MDLETFSSLPDEKMIKKYDIIGRHGDGLIPVSVTTFWRMLKAKDNTFPPPVMLSRKTMVWRVGDVRGWMARQVAKPYTPTPVIK